MVVADDVVVVVDVVDVVDVDDEFNARAGVEGALADRLSGRFVIVAAFVIDRLLLFRLFVAKNIISIFFLKKNAKSLLIVECCLHVPFDDAFRLLMVFDLVGALCDGDGVFNVLALLLLLLLSIENCFAMYFALINCSRSDIAIFLKKLKSNYQIIKIN